MSGAEKAASPVLAVVVAARRLVNADRYGLPGEYGRMLMELTHAVDALGPDATEPVSP